MGARHGTAGRHQPKALRSASEAVIGDRRRAGGQVVQPAAVRPEDQRRDHQADHHLHAAGSAAGRPAGRCRQSRTTRSRVASLPNEPPASAVARSTRARRPPAYRRRSGGSRVQPAGRARRPRPGWRRTSRRTGRGCDGPRTRSRSAARAPRQATDRPASCRPARTAVTSRETNRIRSRNCPCLGCGQAGAASHRRLSARTDFARLAPDLRRPRRTNVRKQRRAAEVHQGRRRRDGRRPVL